MPHHYRPSLNVHRIISAYDEIYERTVGSQEDASNDEPFGCFLGPCDVHLSSGDSRPISCESRIVGRTETPNCSKSSRAGQNQLSPSSATLVNNLTLVHVNVLKINQSAKVRTFERFVRSSTWVRRYPEHRLWGRVIHCHNIISCYNIE